VPRVPDEHSSCPHTRRDSRHAPRRPRARRPVRITSRIRMFGASAAEVPRRTTGLLDSAVLDGSFCDPSGPLWRRQPPYCGCGGAREPGGGAPRRHSRSSRTSQARLPRADSRSSNRTRKPDTWPRSHLHSGTFAVASRSASRLSRIADDSRPESRWTVKRGKPWSQQTSQRSSFRGDPRLALRAASADRL
jgi:hypothetical protein